MKEFHKKSSIKPLIVLFEFSRNFSEMTNTNHKLQHMQFCTYLKLSYKCFKFGIEHAFFRHFQTLNSVFRRNYQQKDFVTSIFSRPYKFLYVGNKFS